jgi:glycosyltransferase involved in cell wall biosynthesis
MTAREAMAYGRPVVVTNVGGLADLGSSAVVVPPADRAELRRVLTALLADSDRRARVGEASRDHARKAWSLEAVRPLFTAAYARALGETRAAGAAERDTRRS